MDNEGFNLQNKQEIPPVVLSKKLSDYGYRRVPDILETGDFSLRGNLIDIWLERYKQPIRIDLIGNIIENIYLFNPLTQARVTNLKEIYIIPLGLLPSLEQRWVKKEDKNLEKIFLNEIKIGDLVVHIDHGVGKFVGFRRDELIVEYSKGDKLFVPVKQLDRLAKYIGTPGVRAKLNSLGTASWEKTKARVQESVIKLAKDLLLLYSKRELVKKQPFEKDTSWQRDFEASFPYQETSDQLKSMEEIKKDLESSTPMDRILIGDVGFGKTEVALRTAFKAVQNGYQVAVLVPTTILAEQHFQLFKDRLKNFPVEVGVLSRFRGKEEKDILERLSFGSVDIIIGTHRLLSDDIKLKRLGLLIIDEEHRFGVKHKEKFKNLKKDVDILSLTATPIPRTLQMALSGIRKVSVLSSAPYGRQTIQTAVKEYSEELIIEAISKEIERGGQVYYVFNSIERIAHKAYSLRKLLPKAKIAFAHGQMPEGQLGKTMAGFFSGGEQVLVCTTIISSGLDMPNVNTIIVEDSQNFGLADLHQLRGRVGRSERKAIAIFFYPKGYLPQGDVLERLMAIAETTDLGGGFKLAQRDLEIRGAGNLLGKEQSGNINIVGFTLYTQLLNQAVEKLKK